ncbi:heme biosynthesis HemY N-terminal domain-containing protein [Elioraea sp.]|uniref:heme biosynthesis HemY N-terminal domain-containing protein n=1 Tax=Elioraea sp. TaxID=2185103 RepID=UPI003F71198A
MRRALVVLLVLALAAAAALWIADRPGTVALSVADLAVEAPLWLVGLGLALLLIVFSGLVWLLARLRGWLQRRRLKRALRHRDDGDAAVVAALEALAAGDGPAALKNGRRARKLLGDTPLTLLLTGHAARAAGEIETAEQSFRSLAGRKGAGAFLGHRGLAQLAVERGSQGEAVEAAKAALSLRPNAGWAQAIAFGDSVRHHDWQGALRLLPEARGDSETGYRRAALLLAAAGEETDATAAQRLEEEAVSAAPGLAPAHAALVRRLRAAERTRAADKALERGLAAASHPVLAALAVEASPGEPKGSRARRVASLAGQVGGAEMALAAARAALEAEQWAEARRWVERGRAGGLEDRRLHVLLAELAEREFAGTERARIEAEAHWRDAATAPAEPVWTCTACGATQPEWTPACTNCGTVGSLRWGEAAAIAPRLALPAPIPGL